MLLLFLLLLLRVLVRRHCHTLSGRNTQTHCMCFLQASSSSTTQPTQPSLLTPAAPSPSSRSRSTMENSLMAGSKLTRLIFSVPYAQGAKEVALETTSFSKLAGFTGIRLGFFSYARSPYFRFSGTFFLFLSAYMHLNIIFHSLRGHSPRKFDYV